MKRQSKCVLMGLLQCQEKYNGIITRRTRTIKSNGHIPAYIENHWQQEKCYKNDEVTKMVNFIKAHHSNSHKKCSLWRDGSFTWTTTLTSQVLWLSRGESTYPLIWVVWWSTKNTNDFSWLVTLAYLSHIFTHPIVQIWVYKGNAKKKRIPPCGWLSGESCCGFPLGSPRSLPRAEKGAEFHVKLPLVSPLSRHITSFEIHYHYMCYTPPWNCPVREMGKSNMASSWNGQIVCVWGQLAGLFIFLPSSWNGQ
jgi:hypothetical protein